MHTDPGSTSGSVLSSISRDLSGKSAGDILHRIADRFRGEIVCATSFGLEDQVLTDLILRQGLQIPLITLDTGRLFPETYELWERTEQRYGIRIQAFFPLGSNVEQLVNDRGINSFTQSVEYRKDCCRVRKLEPLSRALKEQKAWICGLRRSQSVTRQSVEAVEWDSAHGLYKFNPLFDWSEDDLRQYIKDYDVPYNSLHDRGFPSIGCACCTRAVRLCDDVRQGRWWWEEPEHKECGLHNRPRH